jgi:hypothetical protein
LAIKYTREGYSRKRAQSGDDSRWVVAGRSIPQTRRRNLAIFMGICIASLILLLYHNLQDQRSNRWLPNRINDAVVADKIQETQGDDTQYFVIVEVNVPPAVPKEKSLLVGDTNEIEKKSAEMKIQDSVKVDKASWDASTIGDELRALYMITMQRDKIKVHDLADDFMNAENPEPIDDAN